MKNPLGVAAVFAFASISAQAAGPELSGPETLAPAFVSAWNSHDGKQFEKLFTANAYWVPTVDSRLDGRAAITADLEKAHATWARHTTLAIDEAGVVTRHLATGVDVVLFHAPFRQADGSLTSPGNAVMLVAVKQPDGWRIAAGQITKPGATVTPHS